MLPYGARADDGLAPIGTTILTRARVVLAEDHPRMVEELTVLLAADFDVVETVPSGRSLVESVHRVRPDVIVCDIAMPGGSGLAAAARILESAPDSLIVFVTVQDDRAVIRRALDLGVAGYVLKGDAGEELVNAVRTALAGGSYISENARLALASEGRRDE